MNLRLLVIAFGVILTTTMCATPTLTPTPKPTSTPTPKPTPTVTPIPLPPNPVELVNERCTVCHSIDQIKIAKKSAAEWKVTVETMVAKGAQLNPDEQEAVIKYLSFDGRSFIERKCSTCHPANLAFAFDKKETEWQTIIMRKSAYGVEMDKTEQSFLLGYLIQKYPQ